MKLGGDTSRCVLPSHTAGKKQSLCRSGRLSYLLIQPLRSATTSICAQYQRQVMMAYGLTQRLSATWIQFQGFVFNNCAPCCTHCVRVSWRPLLFHSSLQRGSRSTQRDAEPLDFVTYK